MGDRYRFQMYERLFRAKDSLMKQAAQAAKELGIPEELKGQIGLSGAVSSCPGPLGARVRKAVEREATRVVPLRVLAGQIREIVKDVYGDDFDAVAINTCEAALWVCADVLLSPPSLGRGLPYRARYLTPYERHMHHQGSYGRPFPPMYKELCADRGVTAGELGVTGKRQENLDAVHVRLVGARYENHGIKYCPVPLLTGVDSKRSAAALRASAERHASQLAGIVSLAYDLPGYGYGQKDEHGTPVLMQAMGELAQDFGVPYIANNALGVPFVGVDPRNIGADVMMYSMDKAAGSPTCGLIIGKEEVLYPIRRALGVASDRSGASAYGKAAYVTNDPGKEALVGLVEALTSLRDDPHILRDTVDQTHLIVRQELDSLQLPQGVKDHILVTPSYNCGTVEINYENTWRKGWGIPVFSIEDMYAGTALLQTGLAEMGIVPCVTYDANVVITPGLGTVDDDGRLIEENMRLAVRGLVRMLDLVYQCAYR